MTYTAEDGSDWEEFGDFTLKFFAKLTDNGKSSEGSWVCVCTSLVNREVISRYILLLFHVIIIIPYLMSNLISFYLYVSFRKVILATSAFDSRGKLMQLLNKEFQGGTFSLSATCTNRDVTDYYRWLKNDYAAGEQKHCELMKQVGYQGNDCWCFSEQVY